MDTTKQPVSPSSERRTFKLPQFANGAATFQGISQRLHRLRRPAWLGTLRRTTPLSTQYGFDRGTPIDRYYIERFLSEHKDDIHGHVLEIKDRSYTGQYGFNVEQSDVLDIDPTNPVATIISDLADAATIPDDQFDCFLLTQTLQYIYDTAAAIYHAHRILRPYGVLLATLPGISRIDPTLARTDYWRFTPHICTLLFARFFGAENTTVHTYGNVLTSIAFLTGMASEELSDQELTKNDEHFPLIITVRATKR